LGRKNQNNSQKKEISHEKSSSFLIFREIYGCTTPLFYVI